MGSITKEQHWALVTAVLEQKIGTFTLCSEESLHLPTSKMPTAKIQIRVVRTLLEYKWHGTLSQQSPS
jgi:hypothetical protein